MRRRVSREVSLTGQAQLLESHPSLFACPVQGFPWTSIPTDPEQAIQPHTVLVLFACTCGDCPNMGQTFWVPALHLTKQAAQDIPNCFHPMESINLPFHTAPINTAINTA